MANLILDNFYSGNETAELVGTRLLELFEELELNPVIKEDVAGKIGFRDEVVYDKKGYWKTVLGVEEAPIVDEFDTFVIQDKEYGPDKSYALNRYFLGKGFSSTAELWMSKHSQSTTLEKDIQKDIAEIGGNMRRQHASIMIARNNLMTKILTKGFSISAPNGPGSASPYGQPLFSGVHPIGSTGSTQSNLIVDVAGVKQVATITVTTAAAENVTVTLNGVNHVIATSTTTVGTSATEIAAAIDALADYTASATGAVVTITAIDAEAQATPVFTAVTSVATVAVTTAGVDAVDAALSTASLSAAVELLRNMKDGKGNFLDGADVYKLVVSPRLEKVALEILSGNNGFSAYNYEGAEAQNGNFRNFFISENGFKVELVVLKTIGQPDAIDGGTIGTDAMWFVINPDTVSLRGAFKKMNEVEKVGMYKDEAKNATFFKVETWFGAEFIYPECIVGSQG